MTHTEFSNEFDILYNNIMSNDAPGIDEYEKSVLLTKAQDEIIKNYFNPAGNKYQQGFDGSIKRQHDFSCLMRSVMLSRFTTSTFDNRALGFKPPEDLFLPVNEYILVNDKYHYQIVPITYEEYTRLMSKPYGYPPKRMAWRLITNNAADTDEDDIHRLFEVIGRFEEGTPIYHMRYIRRPKPIILVDLGTVNEGLSINGEDSITECELPEELHAEILQRAVEIAKLTYVAGTAEGATAIGQRSE